MMRALMCIAALAAGAFAPVHGLDNGDKKVSSALNFKMKDIDGKETDLSKYQGKVILFVNVASKCGYTPQYKGLQALHDRYEKQGFVVIGVPANEFGGQEPGTDKEIAEFCKTRYSVSFPMLAKVVVKGDGIVPLYKHLTSKDTKHGGDIKWNFTKFLINRDGHVVGRYEPGVKPESDELTKAIEAELNRKN